MNTNGQKTAGENKLVAFGLSLFEQTVGVGTHRGTTDLAWIGIHASGTKRSEFLPANERFFSHKEKN
jgi:hypothetical protein